MLQPVSKDATTTNFPTTRSIRKSMTEKVSRLESVRSVAPTISKKALADMHPVSSTKVHSVTVAADQPISSSKMTMVDSSSNPNSFLIIAKGS